MFKDYTGTPLDELPLVCVHPGASPEAWPIAATAVELFEAMPEQFTFDELADKGQAAGSGIGRVR